MSNMKLSEMVETAFNGLNKRIERLESQLATESARADAAEAKLSRLREAANAVTHHDGCAALQGEPCDCYVDDLDKALEDKP